MCCCAGVCSACSASAAPCADQLLCCDVLCFAARHPPPLCRYAERQVQRQLSSKRVKLPATWQAEFAKHPADSNQSKVGGQGIVCLLSRRRQLCDTCCAVVTAVQEQRGWPLCTIV
jgi:hypothetical protein